MAHIQRGGSSRAAQQLWSALAECATTGIYTYAKMELDGETNKLTIIFDKALKGKKVQIEPFRGTPDINNAKDYVRTTTVKDIPTPKIIKRDTAKLWLRAQCERIENSNETIEYEFLTGYGFKLETPNTIHIYYDGKMSKLNLEGLKEVKYRYHDSNGNKHNICKCEHYETWKMGSGNTKKIIKTSDKTSATVIDYKAKKIKGVSAYKSYILSNNDVYTEGEKGGWGYSHVYYKALDSKVKMVVLPTNG